MSVAQWPVRSALNENLDLAEKFLRTAARQGASLCLLPEMFQTPYELEYMRARAEPIDGESVSRIRAVAGELGLHVVAGSFSEELEDGRCANTAVVIGSDGGILGTHRKIHLFDVDLEQVQVRESAVFTPGDSPLVVDLPFCRLGVGVCYDARFPAVFHYFEEQGVEVVTIPAAFSQVTGRAHWDILMRSRAVDYQVFLAAACPAPNPASSYTAYGHSLVVDPWGDVLAQAGEGEEQVFARCDPEQLARVRRQLPLLKHRQKQLYRNW